MPKKQKQRDDTEIQLTALGHEMRREIMRALVKRGGNKAVSPREVSGTLRKPLSNVSYHVRVLAECDAITLVSMKPVRGSMQHFYRPSPKFIGLPLVAAALGLGPSAGAA